MAKIPVSICAIVVMALSSAAFADPPPWAGGGKGKGKGHEQREAREEHHGQRHFRDEQRVVVHEYYGEEFRHGKKCPPGLAKKNNGCMPPGQAKKWQVGQPLPANVQYYAVPEPLVVRLGPPPPGHKYVRVAADILLIAVGTSMVVDAIQDLGRAG